MTDLRQHMALTERAVTAAFVNDSLPVHLLGGSQGPHTLSFALRLYQPTKANLAKALKLGNAVEAAIGDSPVRIYSEHGIIWVEVPSPVPVLVHGLTLSGMGLAVPLGMTARRTIAGIDFETAPHLLLVGPTNMGKTTAARTLAYQLAKQNPTRACRFLVSTFKPKDWKAFGSLAHTFALIVTPSESEQAIAWLKDVMYNRTANEIDTPHIFLFLDDLLNLLGAVKGDVASDLREIASLGRGAGIHLIIGTQRLGELGAGGAAITGNIRTRLVFGTADAQDAAQFTGRGESGAEKLGRYKGDALFINDGGTQRVAVAYVADTDLATLRQDQDEWRPWRRSPLAPASTITAPLPTSGSTSAPVRNERGVLRVEEGENTALNTGAPVPLPLARRPPNPTERQWLRRLYEELGSKNQVLARAYGGKNSQTLAWLNEALSEVLT